MKNALYWKGRRFQVEIIPWQSIPAGHREGMVFPAQSFETDQGDQGAGIVYYCRTPSGRLWLATIALDEKPSGLGDERELGLYVDVTTLQGVGRRLIKAKGWIIDLIWETLEREAEISFSFSSDDLPLLYLSDECPIMSIDTMGTPLDWQIALNIALQGRDPDEEFSQDGIPVIGTVSRIGAYQAEITWTARDKRTWKRRTTVQALQELGRCYPDARLKGLLHEAGDRQMLTDVCPLADRNKGPHGPKSFSARACYEHDWAPLLDPCDAGYAFTLGEGQSMVTLEAFPTVAAALQWGLGREGRQVQITDITHIRVNGGQWNTFVVPDEALEPAA